MALVILNDNSRRFLQADAAHKLWEVLNGEREGNESEQKWCLNIKRLYLSRYDAPQSYLDKYAYLFYDDSPVKVHKQNDVQQEKARLPYKD